MELTNYDISTATGFLPEEPVGPLPDYFSEWEAMVQRLPEVIHDKCVIEAVSNLPEKVFSDKTLAKRSEWRRAYGVLSFICQAYFTESKTEPGSPVILPSKLAIPWQATAEYIGVPPTAAYAAVILYNYVLKDPTMGVVAENLDSALKFTRTVDETWFVAIHVEEEMIASSGLAALASSYEAMSTNDKGKLGQNLATIADVIRKMTHTLGKLYDCCSPDFFYHELRPFLGFPENGVIYSGISPDIKTYRSGSGAQDTAIPAFTKFLDVKISDEEQKIFDDLKLYMPAKHREFLDKLECQPSTGLFVQQSNDAQLTQCYEDAVRALKEFRSKHIELVTRYIINARKGQETETAQELIGTGGTVFMKFLKNVRDSTHSSR